jgi:hypothetical protein
MITSASSSGLPTSFRRSFLAVATAFALAVTTLLPTGVVTLAPVAAANPCPHQMAGEGSVGADEAGAGGTSCGNANNTGTAVSTGAGLSGSWLFCDPGNSPWRYPRSNVGDNAPVKSAADSILIESKPGVNGVSDYLAAETNRLAPWWDGETNYKPNNNSIMWASGLSDMLGYSLQIEPNGSGSILHFQTPATRTAKAAATLSPYETTPGTFSSGPSQIVGDPGAHQLTISPNGATVVEPGGVNPGGGLMQLGHWVHVLIVTPPASTAPSTAPSSAPSTAPSSAPPPTAPPVCAPGHNCALDAQLPDKPTPTPTPQTALGSSGAVLGITYQPSTPPVTQNDYYVWQWQIYQNERDGYGPTSSGALAIVNAAVSAAVPGATFENSVWPDSQDLTGRYIGTYIWQAMTHSYVRGLPIELLVNTPTQNPGSPGSTPTTTWSGFQPYTGAGNLPGGSLWKIHVDVPNRTHAYAGIDNVIAGFNQVVAANMALGWSDPGVYQADGDTGIASGSTGLAWFPALGMPALYSAGTVTSTGIIGGAFGDILTDITGNAYCGTQSLTLWGMTFDRTGGSSGPGGQLCNTPYISDSNTYTAFCGIIGANSAFLIWDSQQVPAPRLSKKGFDAALDKLFAPIVPIPDFAAPLVNQVVHFAPDLTKIKQVKGYINDSITDPTLGTVAINLTQLGIKVKLGNRVIKELAYDPSKPDGGYSFDYVFTKTPLDRLQDQDCASAANAADLLATCGIVFKTIAGKQVPFYRLTYETWWDSYYFASAFGRGYCATFSADCSVIDPAISNPNYPPGSAKNRIAPWVNPWAATNLDGTKVSVTVSNILLDNTGQKLNWPVHFDTVSPMYNSGFNADGTPTTYDISVEQSQPLFTNP